jgi:hypothetical protein
MAIRLINEGCGASQTGKIVESDGIIPTLLSGESTDLQWFANLSAVGLRGLIASIDTAFLYLYNNHGQT